MMKNFLTACQRVFWDGAAADSFITKTVGVQALLDILRLLAANAYSTRVISVASFTDALAGAAGIDFSQAVYRNASGSGRSLIRRAIEDATGINRP